jgi:hypothetical protein
MQAANKVYGMQPMKSKRRGGNIKEAFKLENGSEGSVVIAST